MSDQKKNVSKNTIKTPEQIEIYTSNIYMLVDDFIAGLEDPEDIKTNKRLLSDLMDYIYNNCVCNILDNKYSVRNRYDDFVLLDSLFNICANICHKYNSNINIIHFTLMCGISRDIIYKWENNKDRQLTKEELYIVKKWKKKCELDLIQGGGVFDIFMLKSNYAYNDNLAAIPLEAQNVRVSTEQLPQFDNVMLTDKENEKT